MKKYLIALDLDGTLLYDWDTLKQETVEYLQTLQKQGHKLVIATGRPYRSSERFYQMLKPNTPLINYNGGLVTWKDNPEFEEIAHVLKKETVIDVFKQNEQHIHNAFCEIKDDIYLLEKSEEIMPLIHYFNGASLHVGPFDETLPSDPNGFIVVANKNHGFVIEQFVKAHYSDEILVRNWGDNYNFILELYTPKTNKGIALKHVAELLGFEQENIIAFGDGNNDIEMIEYAGVGVAMANAHPELLKAADVVSPYSNTENAIERFLKDFLKNK